jgi:DeoR/GlpR family transcriptional regulator of sugar metabolism
MSAISVRRDLAELAEIGALRRVRGGAMPAISRGDEYPFELRRSEDSAAKAAIGAAAAALIAPGDSVLVDNGTTALAVARELAGVGVTAMALSLGAAAQLASKPGNTVLVPGGVVETDGLSFTGAGAADAVRAMNFDTAIIGACAADPATGLTVATWGDAHVKRAVIAASRRLVLVVAPDKLTRTAAHRFGDFSDLDTIVTTSAAPSGVLIDARRAGIQVIVAEPDAESVAEPDADSH